MVTVAKVDGVAPTISSGIQKTIQSIKEIVGSHSEDDIYAALKEANMDPNETAQTLLNQDPFHEVKRKRSKNKENVGNKGSAEPSKNLQENVNEGEKFNSFVQNHQRDDHYKKGEQSQRGGYHPRGSYNQRGGGLVLRGGDISRGDDNQRADSVHKVEDNIKHAGIQRYDGNQRNSGVQSYDVQRDAGFQRGDGKLRDSDVQRYDARNGDGQRGDGNIRGFGFQRGGGFYRGGGVRRGVSFVGESYSRNPLPRNPVKGREFRVVRDNRVNQNTSQDSTGLHQCSISNGEETISDSTTKGDSSKILNNQKAEVLRDSSNEKFHEPKGSNEKRVPLQSSNTRRQAGKSKDSRPLSAGQGSNNSVLGVYSSSSDPVHVPSPVRSSANGSFRREVGVVGVRKMSGDNSGKQSSVNASITKVNHLAESAYPHNISPKGNQNGQNTATGPAAPIMSSSRSFSANNQFGHRSHQQPAAHQKAVQPSKEWKPKSSQKTAASAEVVGLSSESDLPVAEFAADGLKDPSIESVKLPDKHNSQENQGVIIAEHIRVPDMDRCRVTFGSFGLGVISTDSDTGSQTVGGAGEFCGDLSASKPVSASVASNVDVAVHGSPEPSTSDAAVEHHFPDIKDNSSPKNLESRAEIGMVCHDNTSYAAPELQKQDDAVDMGSFSAYDPQTGYDVTYFRQTDEAARGGLPSGQEVFNSHVAGMIPASQALYQQQAQITQMYPQLHVSHYMPYRQFIPPVYVPPMGMPGYSTNSAYAHPANGNGYVLMPGGSSHLNANAMKYGAQQQFKPASGGSPTGFGNYATPNGYTVNAPGGMLGAAGIDDPSRLKYKDGNLNLYVQNSQAEAQEMWMQSSREISGLQSSQYYGMQGQAPHGTYMPSHVGHHAAFSPAAAITQSSHMQFPGLYHPQAQAAAIPNPHHMAPANVGVGVPQAGPPLAQVGSYQQPQINHLQWNI